MSNPSLQGVKVVDFGWLAVAPLHTQWLAEYGATVVRLESHTRPDLIRLGRPYKDKKPGIDRSGLFNVANLSKYGASLDLKKPKGREIAYKFIEWADLMSIGLTQRAVEELKLDYDNVKRIKPDIIYFTTALGGHTGPHANYRGYAGETGSLGGFQYIMGWPDRPPAQAYYTYADVTSPHIGVAAIMAALDFRRRTGKGQCLDESQVECVAYAYGPYFLDYQANGRVIERNGNRHPYAAPHGIYRCRSDDRWCVITVFTDDEWEAFCRAIGQPEWTKSTRFSTLMGRKRNEVELDRLVEEWTINHSPEEVIAIMQNVGVPAGTVQTSRDLTEDKQMQYQASWDELNHSTVGRYISHHSFKFSRTVRRRFAAPGLGEHNQYVYKEILGMSDDEISDLIAEGVITTEADLASVVSSL
jgi:crotonobetainyl-CoA:carnitine CoA-transferase CaiB-like acyl-CoA transferase